MKMAIRIVGLVLLLSFSGAVEGQGFGGNPRPSAVNTFGVSTIPLTAPSYDPPAQDFLFYVDPTGNDSNNCTSAVTPCLTIPAAIAKMPQYWKQKCRLYLAAGTYTLSANTWLTPGFPVQNGEPFVIQGTMADSGVGERTITSVGTVGGYVYQVTDSSLTPTLDQYVGYTIRFTSGTAAGMTRIVRTNSTGGLFEMNEADFSASYRPAVGDKFVIEAPASVIRFQGTSSGLNFRASSTNTGGAIIRQVKFQAIGSGATVLNLSSPAGICLQKTQIDLSTFAYLYVNRSTHVYSGSCNTIVTGTEYFNGTTWLEEGAGIYLVGTNRPFSLMDQSLLHGYVVSRGVKLMGGRGSTMFLFGLDMAGGANVYLYEGVLKHQNQLAPLYGRIIAPTTYGVKVEQNSSIQAIKYLDISNSTGDGVVLDYNSQAYMLYVTGTGNTGAGVRVNGQSVLRSAGNNTITGTSGELIVGSQTTTHAAVYGGAPIFDGAGGAAMVDSTVSPSTMKLGASTVTYDGTNIVASKPVKTDQLCVGGGAISWANATLPSGDYNRVAGNGYSMVAVGNGVGAISYDGGTTWASVTLPAGFWFDVLWIGSKYVALGDADSGGSPAGTGQAATSPDGVTWTLQTTPGTGGWVSGAWNGIRVVAVSDSGVAMSSSDGITWTSRTITSATYAGVELLGTTFVAISTTQASTSTDGITWSATGVSLTNVLDIACNSTICVVVGSNFAASSTNGTTWTTRTIPAGDYVSVAWGGDKFVAVTSSSMASSTNGTTWAALTGNGGWGIGWDRSKFIAVYTDVARVSWDGVVCPIAFDQTITGVQTFENGLQIGTPGAKMSSTVRCNINLATGSISGMTFATQAITCVGAKLGAECIVGSPATLDAILFQSCRVTAADTITLKTGNLGAAPVTPAANQVVSVRAINP